MEYPAKFTRDRLAGGFVVTFPDVPEAITQGDSLEESLEMASEALELALTFYIEKWIDLPKPGPMKRGMRMVRVPALSEAKFRLYTALLVSGIKKSGFVPAAGVHGQPSGPPAGCRASFEA